jgi:hypothetical protein
LGSIKHDRNLQHPPASKKPHDWLLPLIAWAAVGGDIQNAYPAITAIACAQISIILIDDRLDADPRGEYQRLGMPAAANLAAAFQAIGLEALMQSGNGQSPALQLTTPQSVNPMPDTTAYGQYLDILNPASEPDDWLLGRLPLPILCAQAVDHPDRRRFIELRQNIPEPDALTEAQEILVRCGAIRYGIHQ